jgi:hypothetical protein
LPEVADHLARSCAIHIMSVVVLGALFPSPNRIGKCAEASSNATMASVGVRGKRLEQSFYSGCKRCIAQRALASTFASFSEAGCISACRSRRELCAESNSDSGNRETYGPDTTGPTRLELLRRFGGERNGSESSGHALSTTSPYSSSPTRSARAAEHMVRPGVHPFRRTLSPWPRKCSASLAAASSESRLVETVQAASRTSASK